MDFYIAFIQNGKVKAFCRNIFCLCYNYHCSNLNPNNFLNDLLVLFHFQVVNSLLCFIGNFRPHARLEALIQTYFSATTQQTAHAILTQLLMASSDKSNGSASLLSLFDQLTATSNAPIFAAADLNALPMVLIEEDQEDEEENHRSGDNRLVLREIRNMRFFLQDLFPPQMTLEISNNGVRGSPPYGRKASDRRKAIRWGHLQFLMLHFSVIKKYFAILCQSLEGCF